MRISTTTIESFRLFMQPEQDWMAESDLIDTICGRFTGNRKVWIGQAFGAALETPDRYRVSGGYRVTPRGCDTPIALGDDVMGPALALIDRPQTVFEAKGIGVYDGHDVVAKADQLIGARLVETKTTAYFDFDKYAASCQWRFMLDIFQVPSVTYQVFCLDEDEPNGVIRLKGAPEVFTLYTYPELHTDCLALVRDFAAYVDVKGLRGVLDARQQKAA